MFILNWNAIWIYVLSLFSNYIGFYSICKRQRLKDQFRRKPQYFATTEASNISTRRRWTKSQERWCGCGIATGVLLLIAVIVCVIGAAIWFVGNTSLTLSELTACKYESYKYERWHVFFSLRLLSFFWIKITLRI